MPKPRERSLCAENSSIRSANSIEHARDGRRSSIVTALGICVAYASRGKKLLAYRPIN